MLLLLLLILRHCFCILKQRFVTSFSRSPKQHSLNYTLATARTFLPRSIHLNSSTTCLNLYFRPGNWENWSLVLLFHHSGIVCSTTLPTGWRRVVKSLSRMELDCAGLVNLYIRLEKGTLWGIRNCIIRWSPYTCKWADVRRIPANQNIVKVEAAPVLIRFKDNW